MALAVYSLISYLQFISNITLQMSEILQIKIFRIPADRKSVV